MNSLVERARKLATRFDPEPDFPLYGELADHIEALERDICKLIEHSLALEAALREIMMLNDITNMSKQYSVRHAAAIARRALDEGK